MYELAEMKSQVFFISLYHNNLLNIFSVYIWKAERGYALKYIWLTLGLNQTKQYLKKHITIPAILSTGFKKKKQQTP